MIRVPCPHAELQQTSPRDTSPCNGLQPMAVTTGTGDTIDAHGDTLCRISDRTLAPGPPLRCNGVMANRPGRIFRSTDVTMEAAVCLKSGPPHLMIVCDETDDD